MQFDIVGTAESRITLLTYPNFLRQPSIPELLYKGDLVIYNYGKSDTVILEYVLHSPKSKKLWNPCVFIHADNGTHLE